jgi:hypothetical protein
MSITTTNAGGSRTQLAFTSSQAATYLGVSLATVRRTPGGQRRFSREQLDGFLRSLRGADDGLALTH